MAEEDTEALMSNEKTGLIMQRKLMRIAKEAIKQGGVLSSSVAAGLLGIKQATISKHVREYYEREGK